MKYYFILGVLHMRQGSLHDILGYRPAKKTGLVVMSFLLILVLFVTSAHAVPMTDTQYSAAKAQLDRLMFNEDLKDYEKKVSMDRNGVITVINHRGKRFRGTANNLFVAFNSNSIFLTNLVYYGFVWDNKFDIFSSHMIYARQFKTMTAGKDWARHMMKETAKLAAMTGHASDPLAEIGRAHV